MLGEWIEKSVEFQTGDVLGLYAIIFGTLLVIAVVNFINASRKNK